MVNVNKLRGKIVEKSMTVDKLADKIGIDRTTFYRRLNSNGENFLIKEADAITKVLGLNCEEATAIFFAQYVA
jgi:hypothetical protein